MKGFPNGGPRDYLSSPDSGLVHVGSFHALAG